MPTNKFWLVDKHRSLFWLYKAVSVFENMDSVFTHNDLFNIFQNWIVLEGIRGKKTKKKKGELGFLKKVNYWMHLSCYKTEMHCD